MEIGFIGLGKMGFPMARRLIEAGHTLTVFDTQKAAIDRLVALGAKPAASVKDIADAVETADECLQLHGGYGYMQEYPISRMFIDSRIQKIYGGTNEIMKLLIARSL